MELKTLEECTPSQREFIGSTFPTPKGGVLTVVGCCREKRGGNVIFKVECSICSADTELFPEGFNTSKGNLESRNIPCGCTRSPQWNENQHLVRVKRECSERGYSFIGWAGVFCGSNTKVKLHNPKTNNTWVTTKILSFMQGHGDPEEKREKVKKASIKCDSLHIKGFMQTGSFIEGTAFERNTMRFSNKGHFKYWNVTCPKCSSDEYVNEGLCSGVFVSQITSLKKGHPPCRCSKNYKWSQTQREYQIKKLCSEERLSFGSFEGVYKNNMSTFSWKCTKDHENLSSVNSFLSGHRCKTCKSLANNGEFGLYKHRTKEQDYLYIYKIKGQPYIKIGRSFEPDKRLRQNQSRINKYYGNKKHTITQTHLFTGTHEEIYNLEQDILSKEFVAHSVDLGDGYGSSELLQEDCYDDVVAFCEGVVEEVL